VLYGYYFRICYFQIIAAMLLQCCCIQIIAAILLQCSNNDPCCMDTFRLDFRSRLLTFDAKYNFADNLMDEQEANLYKKGALQSPFYTALRMQFTGGLVQEISARENISKRYSMTRLGEMPARDTARL